MVVLTLVMLLYYVYILDVFVNYNMCSLLLLIKYQMELTNDFFFFASVEEQNEVHHLF